MKIKRKRKRLNLLMSSIVSKTDSEEEEDI